MDDDEKTILGCVGVIGFFAIIPIISLFEGLCISLMWNWFIVPFGIGQISIAHCIGISALLSIMVGHARPNEKDKETTFKSVAKLYARIFYRMLLLLTVAFIASRFM